MPADPILTVPKTQDFLLLSRTHKWWRATVVCDLYRRGLLSNSTWSYNTIDIGDQLQDNPIETSRLDIDSDLEFFLDHAPYTCDNLSSDEHNDHHLHVSSHYTNTYCSIVLETLFDVDGSGGAFLTEKTFKCLKHGHPFVIVGAAGSLAALRDLGYRVFDHCIDNSYDLIKDNTLRWQALVRTIQQIKSQDLYSWHLQCQDDLLYNQQLFLASKWNRLNRLDLDIQEME